MPKLMVPGATYFSPEDEASFFGRLAAISGVTNVKGKGRVLEVTLRSKRLSQPALRELLALHFRYRLPMRALAQFETAQNRRWFRSPAAYWHKKVFGEHGVKL
jgi:hypothetical protein